MIAQKLPTRRELTRRRKALGWSLSELARRAGKDRTYVLRIFSGEYWPSPEVYPVLVRAVERGEREVWR